VHKQGPSQGVPVAIVVAPTTEHMMAAMQNARPKPACQHCIQTEQDACTNTQICRPALCCVVNKAAHQVHNRSRCVKYNALCVLYRSGLYTWDGHRDAADAQQAKVAIIVCSISGSGKSITPSSQSLKVTSTEYVVERHQNCPASLASSKR